MSPDRKRIQDTEATLKEVTSAVKVAQAALGRGDVVDLTGLDRIVAGLCSSVRAMPSLQSRHFTPLLSELIDELARLADAMAVQRDQFLKSAIENSDRSAAGAAAAYRKHHR